MALTLADVADRMASRGLVALNVARKDDGWQASARVKDSDGWIVMAGPTIEGAVLDLLARGSVETIWRRAGDLEALL